ncbi:precorrin-6Y C5,15-methyltransferase (decarboxylating) [Shimia isoporae]|uniref:Precorrin-6Y C5,15-methyltransferase (Decarboxylating) n=1 Tax=Shimia isoporae TaxID=647720 RepID=A0A4R1NNZ6_9RHOB|nr:precorrin-6y C5,15-methyltransferase (decarboxylating) subunit CbiE [Shimia isoporae]TCL10196.1 precorrin-6Y C5,15-methyltransferase (decarboxylating) [Shimia isoporae]
MSADPWLTIVGLNEDGPDGLAPASRKALADAEVVMGASRHLTLLSDLSAETIEWPVPFANGIPLLLDLRGRKAVVLASGDPFWHGAGAIIAQHLSPSEWRTLPAPSTMSLAAAALGWPLESTLTMGLHAAPFSDLRPHLSEGQRAIITVRDGGAVSNLANWLSSVGFGRSTLHILEALGGPRERIRQTRADESQPVDIQHPVSVALEFFGGSTIPLANGRPDHLFENDGQITKRPVRALSLSALAPQTGEHLWDIGGGSGSIAIEWLLAHPSCQATIIENDKTRAARIAQNAANLGAARLNVVVGAAPDALSDLPLPDAVFVGGGISDEMLTYLWENLPEGTRVVANAVTLEAEVLLATWHEQKGGDLLRVELAHANPLGRKRGWKSSYPIVQWSVTK